MGLIWEISARAARQNAWNFGARLFCKNIKKSGFNDIYNIQFFQDTYSQNGFFRKCFSHPTRPPVRPARPSWITSYQTGSCSSISQFTGHQTGSCSSISQFTSHWNDSCPNIGARYPEIGSLKFRNIVILSFTAKSGALDHPIRPVSSSWYERNQPKHFLVTF